MTLFDTIPAAPTSPVLPVPPAARASLPCNNCHQAATRPVWGGYSLACANCCARLVISARPWRDAQESFFALFARRPENPSKDTIIAAIQALTLRHSHAASNGIATN